MKASLCFLILALFQSGYCTPTFGLANAAGGDSGASDCEGADGGTGDAGGSGGHGGDGPGFPSLPGGGGLPGGLPGGSGLPGGAGIPGAPGGAGVPGVGGAGLPGVPGGSFACVPCADDDTDCSPITGLTFAQPAKVAPGGVGTIALAAPQLAIIDKAKSELIHGAEAAVEAASHADVDKCLQLILNAIDKVAVRAGQLIDTCVPGVGSAAIQIYAQVSKAAHVAAKSVSTVAVGVTGGAGTGLLSGSVL